MHRPVVIPLEDLPRIVPVTNGVNLSAADDDDDDDIVACVFGVLGAQFCLTDPFTLAALGPRVFNDVRNILCQKGIEIPDGIPLFDPCDKTTNPIW